MNSDIQSAEWIEVPYKMAGSQEEIKPSTADPPHNRVDNIPTNF